MGRLQYISSTNGAFNSVLAQNVTQDSVIEAKFLSTDYSTIIYFGDINADVVVRHWYGTDDMYWHNGGVFQIESYWTLNEEHAVSFSTSEYKFDEHTFSVTGTCNIPATPKFNPQVKGRIYYFKITDNGVDRVNLVGWEENDVVGLKDLVSGNFYQPSSGTWTAGPQVQDDTNIVPVNKYKLYTSNIQKTYNGSTQINKMYIGSDLVYRAVPTTIVQPCGSGIPSDEVWYKASTVIYPFRPYYQNNSWFECSVDGTGSSNYVISNTYDSTDGWYKMKWSCDFVESCGSGWYMKSGITEVIYPDCFEVEDAENWNRCTGITKITYGNSVTELYEGACPPNVTDIYMYTTTPPDMNPSQDQRGGYFRLHNSYIPLTLHLPYGSDWSGVTLPSEVTVVYDLCV